MYVCLNENQNTKNVSDQYNFPVSLMAKGCIVVCICRVSYFYYPTIGLSNYDAIFFIHIVTRWKYCNRNTPSYSLTLPTPHFRWVITSSDRCLAA